jgi:putative glycosyltransferase (TIGR04372 family)
VVSGDRGSDKARGDVARREWCPSNLEYSARRPSCPHFSSSCASSNMEKAKDSHLANPVRSWRHYVSPSFYRAKLRERGLSWVLGRIATKLLRWLVIILFFPVASVLRLLRVRFVFIVASRIGHLAVEPDCYIKEGLLGTRSRYRDLACVSRKEAANAHLLGYWQQYLRIVTSPTACWLLKPFSLQRVLRFDAGQYSMGMQEAARFPEVQARWGDRPPLLRLSDEDLEYGWTVLGKLGVPQGAWFVCFHSREAGYSPSDDLLHSYRNSDIEHYLSAIEAITAAGGWCIRMGDPSVRRLHIMERVIHYPHLEVRSDRMDVFLCAACRFFLGNTSGIGCLASVFGVPVAAANLVPLSAALPYGRSDLGIPKLLWSLEKNRYLTFKEVFSSPISNYRWTHLYEKAKVRVDENSPDDIRDLVIEMLERIAGTVVYTEQDEALQSRFKQMMGPSHYSYGSAARIGRDFLQKYRRLLDDE